MIEDKTDEMKNDSKQQNDSVEISPKLNVVVSLVNIKDNLDSLSPEMREQFLELSRDMDTVAIDSHSTENDEKVPDSGHGSTADTTDEEISVNSSQNEPLDLSVQHERDSNDDLLDLSKFNSIDFLSNYSKIFDYSHFFPLISSSDQM